MSIPKEMVGVRLPADWIEQLRRLSEETGLSQTELMMEAIGSYLGKDVSGICDRIQRLERDVDQLKKRLLNLATF